MNTATKCPVMSAAHQAVGATANQHWWPNQLNLRILRQNHPKADPNGEEFNYGEEFMSLDFDALAKDVDALMTLSQDWWPADYGHYGPLFIRMTWHAAGTYRIHDGRGGGGGGDQRFAPLNSWPDNVNLDKARQLLWPVKQKYGRKISWADLLIFAGNRALETMGFRTFGFGGGREDIWAPEEDAYWGPERVWLDDERYGGDRELATPLGAVQMGLIYVNPEGPNGNPDPMAAARDIRETFRRMAMNDEETVALIAGGHTFGKAHGAAEEKYKGPEPEGASIEEQGLGWTSSYGCGKAGDADRQRARGRLDRRSDRLGQRLFREPVQLRVGADEEPCRRAAVDPEERRGAGRPCRTRTISSKRHAPMMLTTDLALIVDPAYKEISRRFYENPDELADAFARAWYKLLHRDMGPGLPVSRPVGARGDSCPSRTRCPKSRTQLVDEADIAALKGRILDSGLTVSQLVSDRLGIGLDLPQHRQARRRERGAYPSLAPQAGWDVNVSSGVSKVLETLEGIQRDFNGAQSNGKMPSRSPT